MYSQIAGTGSYLPEKVVTNHDLEHMMDTSDGWIRERTGIVRRHIVADSQSTVDLAEPAARAAIAAAGLRPADIDLIVFATSTPDCIFPNCGVLLQQRLGCFGGGVLVDGRLLGVHLDLGVGPLALELRLLGVEDSEYIGVAELQAQFLAGDYRGALGAAAKARALLWTSPSIFETAEYEFYTEVLGGTVVFGPVPTVVELSNSFIVINAGGGPTDDKPTVTLETPSDPNRTSSFLNLRVKDIAAAYAAWSARGAQFLTPPKQHPYETRCYIRDPDGYLIEVGQTTDPKGDWIPDGWSPS